MTALDYTNDLIVQADTPDDYELEGQRQIAWRALREVLYAAPHASHAQILCAIVGELIDSADDPRTMAATISAGRA
jgi:hypothetical protein